MVEKYEVYYSKQFDKCYKKARKKYKHSFDQDFSDFLKVIQLKKENSPQTKPLKNLGETVKHPVWLSRVHITEARKHLGRASFVLNEEFRLLYFLDFYLKNQQENPELKLIREIYKEYESLLERLVSEETKETKSG